MFRTGTIRGAKTTQEDELTKISKEVNVINQRVNNIKNRVCMLKERLSVEKITSVATQYINKFGIESFTMSSLASTLGVTSPHLYKHFSGIEPLIDAVTKNSFAHLKKVTFEAAFGRSGSDALIAIARAYRLFGREFPGEFACTALKSVASKQEIAVEREELVEFYTRIFDEKPSADMVIHKTRIFRSLVYGFVTLENQGAFGSQKSLDKSFDLLELSLKQMDIFSKKTVTVEN